LFVCINLNKYGSFVHTTLDLYSILFRSPDNQHGIDSSIENLIQPSLV